MQGKLSIKNDLNIKRWMSEALHVIGKFLFAGWISSQTEMNKIY